MGIVGIMELIRRGNYGMWKSKNRVGIDFRVKVPILPIKTAEINFFRTGPGAGAR